MAEQLTIPQEMIDVAGIGVCLEMGYEPSFRPQREHAEQLAKAALEAAGVPALKGATRSAQ